MEKGKELRKEIIRVIVNYEFLFLVGFMIAFFCIGDYWEKEWAITWKLILLFGMGYFSIKWNEKINKNEKTNKT